MAQPLSGNGDSFSDSHDHVDSHNYANTDSHNLANTYISQSTDPAMAAQLNKMSNSLASLAQGDQSLAASMHTDDMQMFQQFSQSLAQMMQSMFGVFNVNMQSSMNMSKSF
ncbi:hypothetical protein [Burkholderia territorii]|uniref:hypothetical protein n=1 Tax=Burkholderia territorii TaxID=1503055 RepID=UPI000AE121ED|nr:hypothetical protein [Burkholderia territorii]